MVAVERVKQFSELPQERAEFVEPRPSPDWPASGKLVVQDLEIKYAPDLPTVLHKINLAVEPGTRCAIVGSTGSGKVRRRDCSPRLGLERSANPAPLSSRPSRSLFCVSLRLTQARSLSTMSVRRLIVAVLLAPAG